MVSFTSFQWARVSYKGEEGIVPIVCPVKAIINRDTKTEQDRQTAQLDKGLKTDSCGYQIVWFADSPKILP